MDPSPFVRSSFWSVSLGLTTLWISNLGVSPTCIQRFLAVPDINFARKSVFIFVFGLILIKGASCLVGIIMYAHYENCDPVATGQIKKVDQIVPFFVSEVATKIPGLSGLFMAGIFSAALSSMSSGMNTLAGTIFEDFIRPHYPHIAEKRASDVMKCLVVVLGLLILSLVFVVEQMGQIFRISIAVSGLTAGSLLGIFTVGMLSRYVNTPGVIAGAVGSTLIVGFIMVGAQTLPKHPPLPTKTESCDFPFNQTATLAAQQMLESIDEPSVDDNPLIFKLSFMYYTLLGSVLLSVIAYVVSYFTGGSGPFDERCLAPFRRRDKFTSATVDATKRDILYQEITKHEEFKMTERRRMSIDVA